MKVLRVSIAIFVVMCILIGSHSYIMTRMGRTLAEKNERIEILAQNEDWAAALSALDEAADEWEKYSLWAALTISTEDIEQLEIALAQAKKHAELGQKADFFGEFVMFSKLVEHIPHREGFHIEEIL